MELEQYIRLFRKRLWIILLAAILAGGVGYAVRASKPPTYRAAVLISIGRLTTVANIDTSDFQLGQDLAPTYIELAKTNTVLDATVSKLKLPITSAKLRNKIDANLLPNTSLLTLGVTDTDPDLAAKVANEVANELILNSPTNLTSEQQTQLKMAQGQVDTLNNQIDQDRARLTEIESQLAQTKDDTVLSTLNLQRNIILDRIDRATGSVGQFSTMIASLQQRRGTLEILEQAQVPSLPEDSGAIRIGLLGAVLGGGFAVGVVLLAGFWDTSVKTAKDVTKVLNVPVLGSILRYGKKTDGYAERLVSREPKFASLFERYRGIEAYLSLTVHNANIFKPVFIVTSAEPGEGKSITAANLAFVAASMGRRVLLIDADLHHPKIHDIFELSNDAGLVTLLSASMALNSSSENMSLVLASNVQSSVGSPLINPCVQKTSLANLSIITTGPISSKSLQLLESGFLPRWIEIFKFYLDVDMIIVDTPPCLVLSDAAILAGSTLSDVVLVAEAGRTRPETLIRARDRFAQLGSAIVGVILNKVNPRDDSSPTQKYNYYLTGGFDSKETMVLPQVVKR